MLAALLVAALDGLERYARLGEWRQPAARRLAFRELGLAIGLAASERLDHAIRAGSSRPDLGGIRDRVESLRVFLPLGRAIESFWLDSTHRLTPLWVEHRDINDVMLATRLVPEGFLILMPAGKEGT